MSPEAVFAASLPIGCVATVIGCSLTVTVFTRLCGPRVYGRPCALSPGRSLGASLDALLKIVNSSFEAAAPTSCSRYLVVSLVGNGANSPETP